jgi:tRNA1Val (adenine37-N6)-methyltransferase
MNAPQPQRAVSEGHLLGGRVRHSQPVEGFRTGIEPILLAATIVARPGERVLEAGTGSGAALLCLAERIPGLLGYGVEIDLAQAALATANAAANGFAGLRIVVGDIARLPLSGPFDHAFANPPYHAEAGSRSPNPARDQAKRGFPALFGIWADSLARALRARGTLTFIVPAASLAPCLDAMAAADCPADAVLPLWPKPGRAAKLVILRGIKTGRAPLRLLPGLTLHRHEGGYSAAAEAVLRDGARIPVD